MKTNLITLGAVLLAAVTLPAQSLLTEPPLDPAQARAIRAQENAQALRASVIGGLRHSVADLWAGTHEDHVATAAALGSRAAEMFALFEGFRAASRALLLQAGDTAGVAELDAIASRVPARTINPDGTVTITPPPPVVVTE